jgi:hypothetical protein
MRDDDDKDDNSNFVHNPNMHLLGRGCTQLVIKQCKHTSGNQQLKYLHLVDHHKFGGHL